MNKPGFFEGVIVAVILSLFIAAVFTVMSVFFPTRWMLEAVIHGGTFIYILYLLYRSQEKSGKVAIASMWVVYALAVWAFAPSTLVMLFAQLAAIWLVRTLFYHNNILVSLLDLGLITLSVFVSLWTLMHTRSVLLTTWVFFLLQALFTVLPQQLRALAASQQMNATQDDFERAYASAEAAVRQLSSQH